MLEYYRINGKKYQKNIHPKWFEKAQITCSCGNKFETGATVAKIEVEVCSNCHSFYTGNQKFIDSAGRVTRYQQRLEKGAKMRAATAPKIKKDKKTKAKKASI